MGKLDDNRTTQEFVMREQAMFGFRKGSIKAAII